MFPTALVPRHIRGIPAVSVPQNIAPKPAPWKVVQLVSALPQGFHG